MNTVSESTATLPSTYTFRWPRIKLDTYELMLGLLVVFLTLLNAIWYPIIDADGYIWMPMTQDLSVIGSSDGRHRFLFALPAWAFYHLIDLVVPSLETRSKLGLAWRTENFIFFALAVASAFDAIKRLTNSRDLAFVYATFVATSVHFFSNLAHMCVNLHGFVVNYVALWMAAYYLGAERSRQRTLLIPFSLFIGLLMLGKAHYNVIGLFGLYALLFERKYLKDAIIFTVVQAIPFVLWAKVALPYIYGTTYINYEFVHANYSLVENHWKPHILDYGFPGALIQIHNLTMLCLKSLTEIGLAPAFFFITAAFICLKLFTRVGITMALYLYFTAMYLMLANFGIPRHAEDFGPAMYFAAASAVTLLMRFIPKKLVLSVFFVVLAVYMGQGLQPSNLRKIHGEGFFKDFKIPPTISEAVRARFYE